MHAAAEQLLHLAAGRFADSLDGATTLADDDALLPFAFHENRLVDANRAVLLFRPAFGAHGRGVGKFVVQPQIQLFACDLGGEQARGNVRSLIFRIQQGALGIIAAQ